MDISAVTVIDNTVKAAMKEVHQNIKTMQGELKSIRKVVVPQSNGQPGGEVVAAVQVQTGEQPAQPPHPHTQGIAAMQVQTPPWAAAWQQQIPPWGQQPPWWQQQMTPPWLQQPQQPWSQ